jgi:hypothetical protein
MSKSPIAKVSKVLSNGLTITLTQVKDYGDGAFELRCSNGKGEDYDISDSSCINVLSGYRDLESEFEWVWK